MQILSQRDPKWATITLGTKGTIGEYGCTITCLGMASSLTPDLVNERLNRVGGYANGNLIIWSKVKEAIPWMEFEFRGYTYDNDKVLAAVQKNGFCLVEVDGSRIGGTRHWVLYIGGGQMYDPWFGTQKGTSYYPAVGYAVINKIAQPDSTMYRGYDLTNQESMKICVDDHIKVVEGEYVSKEEIEEKNIQITNLQTQIKGNVGQIEELSTELGSANSTIKALTDKVESLNNIIGEYQKEDAVQINDLKDAQSKANEYSDKYFVLLKELRYQLKLSSTIDDATQAENEALTSLQTVNQRLVSAEKDIKELGKELESCADYRRWQKLPFISKIKLLFGGK